MTSGAVWVQFNDGSQLVAQAGVSSITYTSPAGDTVRYVSILLLLITRSFNKYQSLDFIFSYLISKQERGDCGDFSMWEVPSNDFLQSQCDNFDKKKNIKISV